MKADEQIMEKEFVERREYIYKEYGVDIYHICIMLGIDTPIAVSFDARAETWEKEGAYKIDVGEAVIGADEHFNPTFPNYVVKHSTLWTRTFDNAKKFHGIFKVKLLNNGTCMDIEFVQLIKNRPEKLKKLRRVLEDVLRKNPDLSLVLLPQAQEMI